MADEWTEIMKQLYFVRHGLSEMNKKNVWSGQTDTPLTPKGHEQAKLLGQHIQMKGLSFDLIVSSPLQRAHDTAKHIATYSKYPPDDIVTHDLFKERYFGSLEGTSKLSLHSIEYILNESAIDKYEGAEPLSELQRRADEAHQYVLSQGKNSVLVVAHGAFGRALYRSINGLSLSAKNIRYKNAHLVRFI